MEDINLANQFANDALTLTHNAVTEDEEPTLMKQALFVVFSFSAFWCMPRELWAEELALFVELVKAARDAYDAGTIIALLGALILAQLRRVHPLSALVAGLGINNGLLAMMMIHTHL